MYIQTRKEKIATVWKLHATVDELKASMENLANGSGGILQPICSDFVRKYSTRPLYAMRKMATNEETIKDV